MKSLNFQLQHIWHGGDYYPEQWDESVWLEDVQLMKRAHWNVASIGVFSWGLLQHDEETWDFGWLDRIFDILHAHQIGISLATATASLPAWLPEKYPEVLTVDAKGQRLKHGGRHIFCPNSPVFRRMSTHMARRLAERYGAHPALKIWHVGNEYGGNDIGARCFCPLCVDAFRTWLQARYSNLETLNSRWDTAFWGKTFRRWEQIEPPFQHGEKSIQALSLDYNRFQNQSLLACFRSEAEALREITPHIPITTNTMGAFEPLDYHFWAKEMDVASFDNYPRKDATYAETAFNLALTRGLRGGQPWLLVEQTPSQQNWQAQCALKRPNVMRLWSYQAIAHGSESVMYFQWRRTRGGIEKFHGAVIEHSGTPDARVFREVAALGEELQRLDAQTLGGRVPSRVALLFDWENWWALTGSSGPSWDLIYLDVCRAFFAALHEAGILCDIVSFDSDLSEYSIVVAPLMYMVKNGLEEKLTHFVQSGGTFLTTYFSGIADECDSVHLGGYPGPLRSLLGIWVEELDALSPKESNRVVFDQAFGGLDEAPCSLICERLHLQGARALARFGDDFYAGEPAFTVQDVGAGRAYYLATQLPPSALKTVLREVCAQAKVWPEIENLPDGIEVMRRTAAGGCDLWYLLNHSAQSQRVPLPAGTWLELLGEQEVTDTIEMPNYGVAILRAANRAADLGV